MSNLPRWQGWTREYWGASWAWSTNPRTGNVEEQVGFEVAETKSIGTFHIFPN